MKPSLSLLVLAASVALIAAPAAAQQKTVLKFAHHAPVTFPYQDGALKFKEVAEQLSGGKLEVQVLGGAQLGGERDLLEGVRLGTVHIAIGAGALANFAPAYNIVQLPFLIKNQEHMVKVADGPAGALLAQRIEQQGGFKVLGYFSTGDSGIQTVKGPVRTPADLRGAKIRVMENPALIEAMRALGANPTPLPFPEVYTSIKQGVVDGATIDYTALWTTKVYEAIKYVTEPGFPFPGRAASGGDVGQVLYEPARRGAAVAYQGGRRVGGPRARHLQGPASQSDRGPAGERHRVREDGRCGVPAGHAARYGSVSRPRTRPRTCSRPSSRRGSRA